jgi:hypothetical protein
MLPALCIIIQSSFARYRPHKGGCLRNEPTPDNMTAQPVPKEDRDVTHSGLLLKITRKAIMLADVVIILSGNPMGQ